MLTSLQILVGILISAEFTLGIKLHVPDYKVAKNGSTVTIQCNMYDIETTERLSSEDLVWYFKTRQLNHSIYTAINTTASQLTLTDISFSQAGNYTCAIQQHAGAAATATTVVAVGTVPGVANFSCMSRNIIDMWCTWDPVDSYIPTTYEFTFRQYSQRNQWRACPNTTAMGENSCYLDQYSHNGSQHRMKVTATNALDEINKEIWYNPDTETVPFPPGSVNILPQSPISVLVTWKAPYNWYTDSFRLKYKLQYVNEWETGWFQLPIVINDKTYCYAKGLEIHTLYHFKISCKPSGHGGQWSQWSSLACGRTKEAAPSQGVALHLSEEEMNTDRTRDVTITWTLPERRHRNGIIVGFNITLEDEINSINTKQWTINDGNATEFTIKELERYRSYQVSVIAFNNAGSSPASSIRILDPATAPSAPMITKVEAKSNSSILVSWKPPENPNGHVVGYVLAYRASGRRMTNQGVWNHVAFEGDVREYLVTELEAFVPYEFKVQAKNSGGFGGFSPTITKYTMEGVPSGPPVNLTLQAFPEYPTILEAQWSPPSITDRNGIIISYQFRLCQSSESIYNLTAAERAKCRVVNFDILEPNRLQEGVLPFKFNITGLRLNTEYAVSVAAMSTKGVGPASDLVQEKTNIGAPEERPTGVEMPAELVNESEFTVRWSMPIMQHNKISHYEVTARPQNNTKYCQPKFVNATLTETKIANLCGYEMYEINVRACSVALIAEPCGNYSDPVYATTLMGVPSMPLKVKATPVDDSTLKIAWLPPDRPNGPLEDMIYMIDCYSGGDVIISREAVGLTEIKAEAKCDAGIATDALQVTCSVKSSLNHLESPLSKSNEVQLCYEQKVWPIVLSVLAGFTGIMIIFLLFVYCRKCAKKQHVSHAKPLWDAEMPQTNFQNDEKEVFDQLPYMVKDELGRNDSSSTGSISSDVDTDSQKALLPNPGANTEKGKFGKDARIPTVVVINKRGTADGKAVPGASIASDDYQQVTERNGRCVLLPEQQVVNRAEIQTDRKGVMKPIIQPSAKRGKHPFSPPGKANGDAFTGHHGDPANSTYIQHGAVANMPKVQPSVSSKVPVHHGINGPQPVDGEIVKRDGHMSKPCDEKAPQEANTPDPPGLVNATNRISHQPAVQVKQPGSLALSQEYQPHDFLQSGRSRRDLESTSSSSSSVTSDGSTLYACHSEDEENTVPLLQGKPEEHMKRSFKNAREVHSPEYVQRQPKQAAFIPNGSSKQNDSNIPACRSKGATPCAGNDSNVESSAPLLKKVSDDSWPRSSPSNSDGSHLEFQTTGGVRERPSLPTSQMEKSEGNSTKGVNTGIPEKPTEAKNGEYVPLVDFQHQITQPSSQPLAEPSSLSTDKDRQRQISSGNHRHDYQPLENFDQSIEQDDDSSTTSSNTDNGEDVDDSEMRLSTSSGSPRHLPWGQPSPLTQQNYDAHDADSVSSESSTSSNPCDVDDTGYVPNTLC
ncbi:uncharacterized protein [Ptychodera flava]|uniref:uncharacterized protein isoform X2 n=1 Tax=Ptychodera flava TaxID=63121 RepID=UPI00396A3842